MKSAIAGLKQQAPFPLLPAALFTQVISNLELKVSRAVKQPQNSVARRVISCIQVKCLLLRELLTTRKSKFMQLQ